MTNNLPYSVFDQSANLHAKCVDAYAAAAVVAGVMPFGSFITFDNRVVWVEGYDGPAANSFDAVAERAAEILNRPDRDRNGAQIFVGRVRGVQDVTHGVLLWRMAGNPKPYFKTGSHHFDGLQAAFEYALHYAEAWEIPVKILGSLR